MSKAKIEKKYFDQRPILLVIVVLNEVNLEFLHFLEAI